MDYPPSFIVGMTWLNHQRYLVRDRSLETPMLGKKNTRIDIGSGLVRLAPEQKDFRNEALVRRSKMREGMTEAQRPPDPLSVP